MRERGVEMRELRKKEGGREGGRKGRRAQRALHVQRRQGKEEEKWTHSSEEQYENYYIQVSLSEYIMGSWQHT